MKGLFQVVSYTGRGVSLMLGSMQGQCIKPNTVRAYTQVQEVRLVVDSGPRSLWVTVQNSSISMVPGFQGHGTEQNV